MDYLSVMCCFNIVFIIRFFIFLLFLMKNKLLWKNPSFRSDSANSSDSDFVDLDFCN
jgi:hypothetical protein